MLFLVAGVVLATLKLLSWGMVAKLSWWFVAAPFGMAVLWWQWADSTGYTKRHEMKKLDKRREARISRNFEAMGNSRLSGNSRLPGNSRIDKSRF
jgi:small Trp-rich protein